MAAKTNVKQKQNPLTCKVCGKVDVSVITVKTCKSTGKGKFVKLCSGCM